MASLPVARRALRVCALLLGTATLGAVVRAQAPDTTLLRLDPLLSEVAATNPMLQAARLQAAALAEVGAQVGALPDPTASVTAFPYPILTARGAQRSQWRVEQIIPWPGTLALRAQAADLAAEASAYEADALFLDLSLQVKQAYYALYRLQRTDALVRTFQQRLGAFSEAAAIRYEVGRGPQGAILQVQLAGDRLSEQLLSLDRQRETALRTLARLTDRPDLLRADVVEVAPPVLPEEDTALLDLALRLRPEVQALNAAEARAETEMALARKAFFPDFGVALTYSDIAAREMPTTADGRDAFGVMVSARIPLQRGRLRARLEEARLRQAQVAERHEALETEIATRLDDLLYAARREAETMALFQNRLIPQAGTTVESVLAAYTTGQANYLALLDAERERFQLQLGYEDALVRYLAATAALERALGTASLDILGPLGTAASPPDDDARARSSVLQTPDAR